MTRYTIGHPDGVLLRVLDLGAIIQEAWVPDAAGTQANVVLGFGDAAGYDADRHFHGAVVGRYAGRIAHGRFELDGRRHQVATNNGAHALHGGVDGFHRRTWTVLSHDEEHISLELRSPDGDQGFPGAVTVGVTYRVVGQDVHLDLRATTDAPTVVNLTNHAYLHLGGEGSGSVERHRLTLAASSYLAVDADLIPTGEVHPVEGTPFDFRREHALGDRLRDADEQLRLARGYDVTYVLDQSGPVVSLRDPGSGRCLEIDSDQPGLQLYTGNFLDGSARGTSGRSYRQGDGVALETQHFPDSPNRPTWPSTRLDPDETLTSRTTWRFSSTPVDAGRPQ